VKASDLIGARVDGSDGGQVGVVIDLRARVQDDALVLEGLVLARRRLRLFGYERRGEAGPGLLRRIEAFLHRDTKFAAMDRVEIGAPGRVGLAVPWEELPHITEV
jgi:hypothetical protein